MFYFADLEQLVARKEHINPDMKILVRLGSDYDRPSIFYKFADDSEKRRAFIDKAKTFIDVNRLDGLSVSWPFADKSVEVLNADLEFARVRFLGILQFCGSKITATVFRT